MIIPADIIEKTTEYHLLKNTVKSQLIYISIILSLIIVFILLPFIYVDITVQADGMIRPKSEKTEIKPITSGIVSGIFVKEGQFINKGDTLLNLQNDKITSSIDYTNFQISQNKNFISDIKVLLNATEKENLNLRTANYQQSYAEYQQKINDLENRFEKAQKEVKRNTTLFNKGVISGKEYDDLKYSLRITENELKTFTESIQKSRQNDLVSKQNELKQLLAQEKQLMQEKHNFVITAPISGTLEQFTGIYKASNIYTGQTIAVISPRSEKIAELYVHPSDIGYLSKGSDANIQVNSFNYNDWGMLKGKITEISNDYIISSEQAFFRVRCKLNKSTLKLKNGVEGELKKGMTIRSRFIITRRSLWQLLFDNVNDWLNPKQAEV